MTIARPIMIVDGFNLFIRHFLVNESVDAAGEAVGGVIGFLKTLRWLCYQQVPAEVFIVWEQGGGSPRRRHIFPEYKANRAKQKDFNDLYKADGRLNPAANQENKAKQLAILTKALGFLPMCQLYVKDVECDDVIAWLVKNKFVARDNEKMVVSSDKDFFQLLEDDKVKIYDLTRKIILDQKYVKDTFGISPRNITLARTIAGDQSDNIDGVSGVGLKTVANRFPELISDTEDFDIDWLMARCKTLMEENKKVPKAIENISQNRELIKRNWDLMFLSNGSLAASQIAKLNGRIDDFKPVLNKIEYLKTLTAADIPVTIDLDKLSSEVHFLIHS